MLHEGHPQWKVAGYSNTVLIVRGMSHSAQSVKGRG